MVRIGIIWSNWTGNRFDAAAYPSLLDELDNANKYIMQMITQLVDEYLFVVGIVPTSRLIEDKSALSLGENL